MQPKAVQRAISIKKDYSEKIQEERKVCSETKQRLKFNVSKQKEEYITHKGNEVDEKKREMDVLCEKE